MARTQRRSSARTCSPDCRRPACDCPSAPSSRRAGRSSKTKLRSGSASASTCRWASASGRARGRAAAEVTRMRAWITGVACGAAVACSNPPPAGPPAGGDFALFDAVVADAVHDLGLEGAAAVVVHRDSGIAHVQGYGAFDEERVFLIASASKPLSAGVLLRLADQGLLDLDAPIGSYVGDAWGADKAALTVAQLISNSSGLPGLLDHPGYPPYRCQYG